MVTGGDQELWIALRDAEIDMVLGRSERASACMADAYARLTERPAFTYGQWGPGAAVLVGGIVDAFWASTPVIAITSASSTRTRFKSGYQEIHQWPLFEPVCKLNVEVPAASRLADVLRTAYRTAVSGNPGPVHIDVTSAILAEDAGDVDIYAEAEFTTVPPFRPQPDTIAVERAVELLQRARRPIIFAGAGVLRSHAWDELVGLAEDLRIPVATTMGGKGAIAETHPLAIGVAGTYSRRSANELVGVADVVLAVGCALGSLSTDGYSIFAPDVAIVHADIDPTVLGMSYKEAVSMQADAGAALAAFRAASVGAPSRDGAEAWAADVASRTGKWRESVAAAELAGRDGAIAPAAVMRQVNSAVAPTDVVVADTGYMGAWGGALFEVKQAGLNFIRTGGSLGWALPACLGAQIARPDDRAVAIIGDGGIGYHIGDMETAVRRRLPVVVVLLNNRSLAYEYHIQKHAFHTEVSAANDFADTDYSAVARAYGWHAERVERQGDLARAIACAFDQDAPALVECMVDKEVMGPVTTYERLMPRHV
jgi:acetolactate synthase-1/2/3 large subunit